MKKSLKCTICNTSAADSHLLLTIDKDESFYICDKCIENMYTVISEKNAEEETDDDML